MLQKRKRSLIYLRKRGNQMKKKSLFDIAMEKKQNQTTENENIGTTVLTNSTLREQLINIVKFNF